MGDTRGALLEAGVRLYGSMAGDLLRGLSAGTVAREAGFHRQTFYRYWETQSEYVQDLIRHVLGPDQAPVADGAAVLPEQDPPEDLEAFVRELTEHDFVRVVENPALRVRLGLVATDALSQPPLSEQAQEFYDGAIERLEAGYEALFEAIGRRPTASATTRDVARIMQALLLGLVLQARLADDEPHAAVLFEQAAMTLLTGLTEPAS